MEQSTNLFIDNNNLTSQNYLSYLLDFNDEYTDLTHCIQPSKHYTDGNFMIKLNTNSCAIMSLTYQSLHAKFSQIKLLIDTFAENNTPIQVLCFQETWFENSELIDLAFISLKTTI